METSFNDTHGRPTPQPLFDTLVPGSSEALRVLSYYIKIDLSSYLPFLLVLAALIALVQYCWGHLEGIFKRYYVSSVEVREEDSMYTYMMAWISKQSFSHGTHQSVAAVTANNIRDNDNETKDDLDIYLELLESTETFEDYWRTVMHRDKLFKPIRYTPSTGMNIFLYKSRPISFTRSTEQRTRYGTMSQTENLCFSCLGRDPAILKQLLEEAQKEYLAKLSHKTIIQRAVYKYGEFDWYQSTSKPPRPISTVVLEDQQKEALIADIMEYLSPLTPRWYANRGIPYRRGYLLYGPPGTGKTSLCVALAGMFHLEIYVASLNSKSLTEDGLASLFQQLPFRCIVLLEDIDAAGFTDKRDDPTRSEAQGSDGKEPTKEAGAAKASTEQGVSLSGLLNVIDGVASTEGRILVMTTNHIDKLDKALIRPGRVDLTVRFGLASSFTIRGLFAAVYTELEGDYPNKMASKQLSTKSSTQANGAAKSPPASSSEGEAAALHEKAATPPKADSADWKTPHLEHTREEIESLGNRFAEEIPADQFTPAEIQGYLLKHKREPAKAVEEAPAWVQATLEEKRKRAEKPK